MEVVELLVRGIEWWSYDSGERARRSNGEGTAVLCFALLWCGRERAGCEGEMEGAAEARALFLHIGLTGRGDASVRPPCGVPGLPSVGHCRCRQPIQSGDEAD